MDALATLDGSGMQGALAVAGQLARSGLIPRALQGKPQDVLVVLLTGKELGLGPMQSLRGIHVVDGKAVLSADLIVGLCVRERSVCRYFRLLTSTDKEAVYETHREGAPEPTRLSFTHAQAQTAGLTGKQNWRNYPAAMLRARCAAALARAVYPDLMAGVYDPDELDQPKAEQQPAPQPQRQADAEAQVVDAPALPAEGTLRAPSQAVAREAERVARAVGGEVVPPEVAALSDDALATKVAELQHALATRPNARNRPQVEARLSVLSAELERRIASSPPPREPGQDDVPF